MSTGFTKAATKVLSVDQDFEGNGEKAQAKQKRGHDQTASERNAIRAYDMVLVRHAKCQSGETPE